MQDGIDVNIYELVGEPYIFMNWSGNMKSGCRRSEEWRSDERRSKLPLSVSDELDKYKARMTGLYLGGQKTSWLSM